MTVTRVILPKLGLTMDEGKLVAWRKREGDAVAQGEVLFEVETDKATMEVESPAAGVLRRILVAAGETVPVTETIAFIASSADEPLPDDLLAAPAPKPSLVGGVPEGPAGPGEALPPGRISSPASGRLPASRGPSAPEPLAPSEERVRSSPAARRRAEELGVDIARVAGTGPGGRVTLEDVETAAAAAVTDERREPLSRMRRAIGERMTRSAHEAPQFSISRDVDMTAADTLRRREGVSYTDVLVVACARALRAHPRLRSRIEGDALVTSERVHIGVAVALEDGLLVPVIRDADRKDLATLAREREAIEDGAHAGKLPAGALTGGVFTISNLGTLGVDRFTAIVNPPEAAILAVGRVTERVIVKNDIPVVRQVATLTLSVDHRVADGATAARFLADVAERLERGEP